MDTFNREWFEWHERLQRSMQGIFRTEQLYTNLSLSVDSLACINKDTANAVAQAMRLPWAGTDLIGAALSEVKQGLAAHVDAMAISAGLYETVLSHQGFVREITDSLEPLRNLYSTQANTWAELMGPSVSACLSGVSASVIQESCLAWDYGIRQTVKQLSDIGLISQKPLLAARVLEPFQAYTDFAKQTAAKLSQEGFEQEGPEAEALRGSSRLAEAQVLRTADELSNIPVLPSDTETTPEPATLNLYKIQQEELLQASGQIDETDVESLVINSQAACAAETAYHVGQSVVACNKSVGFHEDKVIFNWTDDVVLALIHVQHLIPANEDEFARFIDSFYFIFYEGTGKKDRIRAYVAGEQSLFVIECVKRFRNWFRHDTGQKKPSTARRYKKEIAEALEWLGLKGFPTRPEDFRYLHRRLLEEALQFLDELVNRLTSSGN